MRRWMHLGAAIAALALILASLATPRAVAAGGDQIDEWDATYTVQADGSVRVVESLTYRFGSGEHQGIERGIVVREPYAPDDKKDRVYDLDVISVTADKPVSTAFRTYTSETAGQEGRHIQEVIRIGTRGEYINEPVVTYTLTYSVSGVIITSAAGDEFYWDAVTDVAPPVAKASITVDVPIVDSLTEVSCYVGRAGSTDACESATTEDATVAYRASEVGDGTLLTVAAIFPAGAITNNTPMLVDAPQRSLWDWYMDHFWWVVGIGGAILGAITAGISALVLRRLGRDERFIGLAPGIIPGRNESADVGPDNHPEIPVAFAPPRVAVGEAGLLADGRVDVHDTTATLLDLAVRGAVQMSQQGREADTQVILNNPTVATLPHEQALLTEIFGGAAPGAVVSLSKAGAISNAHSRVTSLLLADLKGRNWYVRMPSKLTGGNFRLSGFLWMGVGLFFVGGGLLALIWPLLIIGLGIAFVSARLARGRRNAIGRAVTDQIEGFREYLATAEADQLRFEEGEDIFSRYLPWATIFGLTDRWTKVCEDLVRLGRIPDARPSWYVGYWPGYAHFDMGPMTRDIGSAAVPKPSTSSGSGSGFSSSGGGGFSGGGGGGGSVGSW